MAGYWISVSDSRAAYMYGPFVDQYAAKQWADAHANDFAGMLVHVVRPTQFIGPDEPA